MGVENRDTKLSQALIGAVALAGAQLFNPETAHSQQIPNSSTEITPAPASSPEINLVEPSGPITPFRIEHALILGGLAVVCIGSASFYVFLVKRLTDNR